MPKNSDNEFVNELFKTYRQMMFKIALGILHNETDAEDVVQDAFLWIINNLDKVSQIPCCERGGYFASIIEHRAIDLCRKRNNHPTDDIDEQFNLISSENIEESAISNMTVEEIERALNELSKRDSEILYYLLFMDYAPKEIAKVLGVSERNISMYITRARKRLIKVLKKRGFTNEL